MNSFNRLLDELYFYMKEFYDFEKKFISNLSQNDINGDIACLVDADEIDKWKANVEYEKCREFLENYDKIKFDELQKELFHQNSIKNKIDLKSYETLDEVCNSLKHNKRISIISQQFYCYLNKITYSPTMFNYYTKNNQLIIYFGTGKCLFIPNYLPNKKLDSENIYVTDLPENKQSFIESIFKYQNMSDTLIGEKSLSRNMNTLLSYSINKNSMKKNKSYNFYSNEEDNFIHSKNYQSNNKYKVNYSNNIDINNSNNINSNISKNNNNENNYKNNIETDKPYIKLNNGGNVDLAEEYQCSQNMENNKKSGNIEYEKNENNIDNILNNKNEEYISYKDKEIEYDQILKERNNIENINNNIPNNNSENNIMNTNETIQQKVETEIKEAKNNPGSNLVNQNNNNNFIEDSKENKNTQDININNNSLNLNTDKEEDIKENNKPELENKDKENQEIITSNITPNGNNIDNINKNELKQKRDNSEDKKIKNRQNGLENFEGKSSYINAVIQCLSHTIPLTNYFLDENNRNRIIQNNISKQNPDRPQLSPSYLNLLKTLWSNNPKEKISPSEFINNLQFLNKSFEKNEENDISELILFILEQLHLELNDNKNNENVKNESKDNNSIIKENFYKKLLNNNSIIYETFFGGVSEVVQECQKCKEDCNLKNIENTKIYEYHKLNYLMFPLNEITVFAKKNNKNEFINIYDCLNYFQNPIFLDGDNGKNCEKCGKISPYILTTKINSCQNNLLMLLKRHFEKDKNIKLKFDEALDITDYVQEKKGKSIYNLYAIISLSEKKEIHYMAFCKDLIENIWYKFDDNIVEVVKNLENDKYNFGVPVALFYQKESNIEGNIK